MRLCLKKLIIMMEKKEIKINLKNKTKELICSLLRSTKSIIILMIFVIFLSKMLSLIVPVLTQRLIDNYQILANLSLATLIGGTILIAGIYYLITVSYSLLLTKL